MFSLKNDDDASFSATKQISPLADYAAWDDDVISIPTHYRKQRVDVRRYVNALLLCLHVFFMESGILISSLLAANSNKKQSPSSRAVSYVHPALSFNPALPATTSIAKVKVELLLPHIRDERLSTKPLRISPAIKTVATKKPTDWQRITKLSVLILVLGSGAMIGGAGGIMGVLAFNKLRTEQPPILTRTYLARVEPTMPPPATPEYDAIVRQALKTANEALPLDLRDKNIPVSIGR